MTLNNKIQSALGKHSAGSHDQSDHGNWAADRPKIIQLIQAEHEAKAQGILAPGFDDDLVSKVKRSQFLANQVKAYAQILDLSNINPVVNDEGDVQITKNLALTSWTDTETAWNGKQMATRKYGLLREVTLPGSYDTPPDYDTQELYQSLSWADTVSFAVTQVVTDQIAAINEAASEIENNDW